MMPKPEFQAFLATKEVQAWLSTLSNEGTHGTYASCLFNYWQNSLSKEFPRLLDWITQVKKERASDDNMTRRGWALRLISWLNGYISPVTHRPVSTDYKNMTGTAVKSFLKAHVSDELDYKFKFAETVEEQDEAENTPAITVEEMRKLYEQAKTARDKALLLVAVNGVAPSEMIQFCETWRKWWPKDLSQVKAPFRVNLIRKKAHYAYHVTLFEDAVEALKSLYEERRMEELGGKVDNLFVTLEGKPLTQNAYERVWELWRERAGLYQPAEIGARQRIHPHGVRHFFRTRAKLHGVDSGVANFALGHKPRGEYRYDKSHLEPKWCEIVEKEIGKMTEVLNLKTGTAQAYYASKEEELKAKILKDFIRMAIEGGDMKPEMWQAVTTKLYLKKLGVGYETFVAAKTGAQVKMEVQQPEALFQLLATAIELDPEVTRKHVDAIKVLRPTQATARWENHTDYYVRTEIGSDDYMQALADDFKVVDSDGKVRILAKPKSTVNEDLDKHADERRVAT